MDEASTACHTAKNPVKAIRLKCRDCSNNQLTEIENCAITACSLYPFRFGKNPFRNKRRTSEKQKSELAKRLEKARQQKHLQ